MCCRSRLREAMNYLHYADHQRRRSTGWDVSCQVCIGLRQATKKISQQEQSVQVTKFAVCYRIKTRTNHRRQEFLYAGYSMKIFAWYACLKRRVQRDFTGQQAPCCSPHSITRSTRILLKNTSITNGILSQQNFSGVRFWPEKCILG